MSDGKPFDRITPELVERVAAMLRADCTLTVQAACLDANISPAAVKKAMQRLRDGGPGGEYIAPITRAVDYQCQELMKQGEKLAAEGSRGASWYQWRLETKQPLEFGRAQKVELSGSVSTTEAPMLSREEAIAKLKEMAQRHLTAGLPVDDEGGK